MRRCLVDVFYSLFCGPWFIFGKLHPCLLFSLSSQGLAAVPVSTTRLSDARQGQGHLVAHQQSKIAILPSITFYTVSAFS